MPEKLTFVPATPLALAAAVRENEEAIKREQRDDRMLTALQEGRIAWFAEPPLLSDVLRLTETLALDPFAVQVIPGGARMVGIKARGA